MTACARLLAVGAQGAAADPPRSPDAADPAVRAGVLPAALRLRAQLRHPQHRARRRGSRSAAPRAATLVSAFVNSGYFDLVGDVAATPTTSSGCSTATTRARSWSSPTGSARDVATGRPAPVQVIVNGDNANTATTVWATRSAIVSAMSARYELQARVGSLDGPPLVASSRASGTTRSCAARCSWCRAHRLHRDAHRRRLDGALDRAREGERHDGAGADGAARHRCRSSLGKTAAVLRHLAGLGDRRSSLAVDGAVRPADARLVARCCSVACRCSWSARWRSGLLISTIADTQQVAFQLALLIVVPADADAVGLHLSDRQHAGGAAGRHARRAGALLPASRCAASC